MWVNRNEEIHTYKHTHKRQDGVHRKHWSVSVLPWRSSHQLLRADCIHRFPTLYSVMSWETIYTREMSKLYISRHRLPLQPNFIIKHTTTSESLFFLPYQWLSGSDTGGLKNFSKWLLQWALPSPHLKTIILCSSNSLCQFGNVSKALKTSFMWADNPSSSNLFQGNIWNMGNALDIKKFI